MLWLFAPLLLDIILTRHMFLRQAASVATSAPGRIMERQEEEEESGELFNAPSTSNHSSRPTHDRREAKQNDQLFTIGGRPAYFHMYCSGYGSLTPDQVEILTAKVTAYGGAVIDSEQDADTIVTQYAAVELLRRKYWDSQTVFVEDAQFVQMCINSGRYEELLHKPMRKGMGGQSGGVSRVAFTAEDDMHLCEYIASVIPDQEADGGRFGREIYQRLVRSAEFFAQRKWALRHPWSSWQQRYKSRRQYLDPVIDRLVEENPPRADGKGLYERSRAFNPKRKLHMVGSDEDEEEGSEDVELQEFGPSVQGRPEGHSARALSLPPKRARHTDVGPARPRVSAVEQGRTMQRSKSFTQHDIVRRNPLDSDNEPFELPSDPTGPAHDVLNVFEDASGDILILNDELPSPQLAGPSGRIPASSQVTLVGTGPTQTRREATHSRDNVGSRPTNLSHISNQNGSATEHASAPRIRVTGVNPHSSTGNQQEHIHPGPAVLPEPPARKRAHRSKRIMVVDMPPNPELFPRAQPEPRDVHTSISHPGEQFVPRAPRPASPSVDLDEQDRGDVVPAWEDILPKVDEDMQAGAADDDIDVPEGTALPMGETYEDEEVEDLLKISKGSTYPSAASSTLNERHPFEIDTDEELDSDDQRTRSMLLSASLNVSQTVESIPRISARSILSSRAPVSVHSDESDEEPPVLSFVSSARRASAHKTPASQPRLSAAPVIRPPRTSGASAGSVRTPANLSRRTVQRTPSSDTDSVPMAGTRAREVKTLREEELKRTPYTPPMGTRAATLRLRNREVLRTGPSIPRQR
ncbi:hypothetical protein IEO21_05147 [Rhodonia placenta]|uniref:Rap1 Myb domain-containing protein n=1 Tax=Rhodonia placenta TaxID=104341 RepID=A0A8H7U2C7_9APHY|nr:hypothetical protein IEO21_05147 [Postia placenta]